MLGVDQRSVMYGFLTWVFGCIVVLFSAWKNTRGGDGQGTVEKSKQQAWGIRSSIRTTYEIHSGVIEKTKKCPD